MIKKTADRNSIDEIKKVSKLRRYLRKKEAEKHNSLGSISSLDPTKYEWSKSCHKCYGRGFIGTMSTTKELLHCKCVKPKPVKLVKENEKSE